MCERAGKTFLDQVLVNLSSGSEPSGLGGQSLFGLRVEGWILDQAVHKDPELTAHKHVFHVAHLFVLLHLALDALYTRVRRGVNETTERELGK